MPDMLGARVASVLVACLGLTMGACAPSPDPGDSVHASSLGELRWVEPAEATEEYSLEARQLNLAPGWTWPDHPVADTGPGGEPVRYERGYGRNEAQFRWYCSWASAALHHPTPYEAERRVALARALRLRGTDYFEALNRRNRRHVAHVLDRAESGDLRGLRRDVKQNCTRL